MTRMSTLSAQAIQDAVQYLEAIQQYHAALQGDLRAAQETVIRAIIDEIPQ